MRKRVSQVDVKPHVSFRLRETNLHWRSIGEELVALDLDSETYLQGNSAAGIVWEMLRQGATQQELANRLVAEYAIEYEHALGDVDIFLGELRAAGLLER